MYTYWIVRSKCQRFCDNVLSQSCYAWKQKKKKKKKSQGVFPCLTFPSGRSCIIRWVPFCWCYCCFCCCCHCCRLSDLCLRFYPFLQGRPGPRGDAGIPGYYTTYADGLIEGKRGSVSVGLCAQQKTHTHTSGINQLYSFHPRRYSFATLSLELRKNSCVCYVVSCSTSPAGKYWAPSPAFIHWKSLVFIHEFL